MNFRASHTGDRKTAKIFGSKSVTQSPEKDSYVDDILTSHYNLERLNKITRS